MTKRDVIVEQCRREAVPPAEAAIWIATEIVILKARLAYREEREYPEYVDLGGEA